MTTATIEEAQVHLAALIAKLMPGEELVIVEQDRPVTRLIGEPRQRKLGSGVGILSIVEDDDSHLEDFKEYRSRRRACSERGKAVFVPERDTVEEFRSEQAGEFVRYWSPFYQYDVKLFGSPESNINYHDELNICDGVLGDLTKENVRRLLRWKDPHILTQEILTGPKKGTENPRVSRVLHRLDDINRFRRGEITEVEIRDVADSLFSSGIGIVFRAFLLHIARPHIYPIADQHVFRACALHTKKPANWKPNSWKAYEEYRNYFHGIADAMRIERTTSNIENLKKIDNALWAFGKFLKRR
jgi:antitoxin (DNA-binding transcriptional repressor) of toxin-antitoxin stability system